MKLSKRMLCFLLAFVVAVGSVPVHSHAAESDGLCAHHTAHDEACGHVSGREEQLCSHTVCDESCLTKEVTVCVFDHADCGCEAAVEPVACGHTVHDEQCGYDALVAAVEKCACTAGEAGAVIHEETCDYENRVSAVVCNHVHGECGYVEGKEAVTCEHTCSVESQCVILQCSHEHNTDCGFAEAVNEVPCTFVAVGCSECAKCEVCGNVTAECTCGECAENCMLEDGHEGDCVLYCETEYCAKAGNHDGECAMACGCPAAVPNHLETCGEYAGYSQQLPMYAHPGDDAFFSSLTESVGNTGPWYSFYAGENETSLQIFNVVSSDENIVQLESNPYEPENGWYRVVGVSEGETTLTAQVDDQIYSIRVRIYAPQLNLLVTPEDSPNYMSLNGLSVGQPVNIKCYLTTAGPSDATQITSGLYLEDESIASLSGPVNGVYTLTPKKGGGTSLSYEQGGVKYSQPVSVMGTVEAEGYLYYPAIHSLSGETYPKTVLNLNVGNSMGENFYFGSKLLTSSDITWSGPIRVLQFDGDSKLYVEGLDVGTGYLEYTADGITHCFVVNVGTSRPDNEIQEGGYMWLNDDVVIGFGNPGIQSAGSSDVTPGTLKIIAQASGGFDDTWPDDAVFREPVAFAAMNYNQGQPEAAVMESVQNVKFSVLCSNREEGVVSLEREACEQVTVVPDLGAWTNYVVAGAKEPFRGLIGMTFDLPDTKEDGTPITRRISLYLLTHNTFMGQNVTVFADISSAKELNVILSSYEGLKKWICETYPEKAHLVDKACNIDINLPGGDFTDAVVVSQAIAPFPFRDDYYTTNEQKSNPNFRVYLHGSTDGTRTKMAGLISRGSLACVDNIDFVSTEGITMTRGDEKFTCGLMADYLWYGEVDYGWDENREFIDAYGDVNGDGDYSEMGGRTLYGDFTNLDCDILAVLNCSFYGFDYGTRSTSGGYVGGGVGNAFSNCYYGIYVDCSNKPGWGEISGTGFNSYYFSQNVVAVRIAAMQKNVTPYEFRIQYSDFYNNYVEFWIDKYDDTAMYGTNYLHNYYFYRNYYSGGWTKQAGNWVQFGSSALGNETLADVGHRGPRYSAEMQNGTAVNVSGTPSSSVPNLAVTRSTSGEGYWVYGGEDELTRVLSNEEIPLAQEALENLEEDAEVSLVDSVSEDTVAVWTFEGGE